LAAAEPRRRRPSDYRIHKTLICNTFFNKAVTPRTEAAVENLWISCLNAAASAAESVASLGRLRPGEDVAFPTRLRRVDCFSSHTRL